MKKIAVSVLCIVVLSTVFYVYFTMQNCLVQLSAYEFKDINHVIKDDICYYKAIGFDGKAENLLLHSVFDSINNIDDYRSRR